MEYKPQHRIYLTIKTENINIDLFLKWSKQHSNTFLEDGRRKKGRPRMKWKRIVEIWIKEMKVLGNHSKAGER